MPFSREQLTFRFAALDAQLVRLARRHALEEERWAAIEQLVQLPTSDIAEADRRWWWEQLYSTMERHGLTELSQLASSAH
ncbi:hypothetical protein [Dyella sp. C11]|uniref:hypothetical protein n=1 Tax=Dyella sp. C11 TaxID=2126991 RepID=UPI000D647AF5|nr:hypothetical protein [Dyella sp. C11]